MHELLLIQVSDDSDDPEALDSSAILGRATNTLDEWVDEMDVEDQKRNAIIMTYHAIHTFHCTRMEAYEKVGKAYHLSQRTVRKLSQNHKLKPNNHKV